MCLNNTLLCRSRLVSWYGPIMFVCVFQFCSPVDAQPGHYHPHGDVWYWHSPGTAMSSLIHAQADMVRAQGARAVDFAAARIMMAEAVDKDLDKVDEVVLWV